MNGSDSAWWVTENGEWRQGTPPLGWWQASDGHWYPPQTGQPATTDTPAVGEDALDRTVPMTEVHDPGTQAAGYPGFDDNQESQHGVVDKFKALPLWARILIPATAFFLVLGAAGALAGDPDEDDADVAAPETTTTTERDTTTTERPTTTSTSTTTTAPPTTTTTAPPPPPPPPPPTTAAPAPPPAPPPTTQSDCHPSYQPCVAMASDVDCAGGSGDGPAYASGPISVTGPDEYKLDNDGDGVACE